MGVEQWKAKPVRTSGTSNLVRTSLRGPSGQSGGHNNNNTAGNHVHASPYHSPAPPAKHKDSMLDKFKLFNHKEKDARTKTTSSSGVSKRTSSSSGFSSARSERSDSSTSVCSDAKPPPLPPHQSLPVSTSSSSSDQAIHDVQQGVAPPPAKPQGLRGIRSKFSKSSSKEGKESPKSSRKDKEREEREGSRGSPRGAHKAHRDPRAERGESRERSGREERAGKKSEKLTLELDGGSRSRSQPPPSCQPEQARESRVAAPSRQEAYAGHATDPHLPPALPPKENPHRDTSSGLLAEHNATAMQHQHYQQQQEDSGLASTPGSPLPPGTPGTGIPKPTAHVKGQTKTAPPERPVPTTPTASPNVNTPHQTKDYNKMVRHQSSSTASKGTSSSSSSSTGAPRTTSTPAGSDPNYPPEPRDPKGSLPRQKQLGRREDPVSGISVALVSPMPIPRDKEHLVTPSESGSNISESSQSNSGHSNSTSSGNSSVIYKPTSSEDDSVTDYKMGKVDERPEGEEGDEVIFNIKPMQPLVRTSQYGYMRGLGLHQARTVPPSLHVSRLALQDAANTVPQKGMRLGPHPKRPLGGNPVLDADYSDLESVELTNGYMSDGDVLRNVGYRSGNSSSDLDGYMSEGGASLYAHRLNQRFKEGMRQVHESMNKVQHFIQDDSPRHVTPGGLVRRMCEGGVTVGDQLVLGEAECVGKHRSKG
ncbi:hypothetical protein GWK47_002791 [Chionoecetes opilio]|uniref:Uncharacterized protein n=1 Tax=Chionoecetes opilio TaxID=41210 RepID=A0A8J4XLB8_CHIOP|nr:hypothetical protein GWK47_002791 [Chionoecetes opilio]